MTAGLCRFCCKSRKSNGAENRAKVDFWTLLLPQGFPGPIRGSVVVFGMKRCGPSPLSARSASAVFRFTRKILLQQYLPEADSCVAAKIYHSITSSTRARNGGVPRPLSAAAGRVRDPRTPGADSGRYSVEHTGAIVAVAILKELVDGACHRHLVMEPELRGRPETRQIFHRCAEDAHMGRM
jgi:hypothetical protein